MPRGTVPGGLVRSGGERVGLVGSGPRTDGLYPRILGQFVRDERLLSLVHALHEMTVVRAARLGFRQRGVICAGNNADLEIRLGVESVLRGDVGIDGLRAVGGLRSD